MTGANRLYGIDMTQQEKSAQENKQASVAPAPLSDDALLGIVLVTHADYGSSILRAAEFVLGPLQGCASISVDGSCAVEETVQRLSSAVEKLDMGYGVILLTDMFGGTPTNLSLSLLRTNPNIEILTGVNLPMLLKVCSFRKKHVSEVAADVRDAGVNGIVLAGEMLKKRSVRSKEK